MICICCGGQVIWMGPLTNLTHTECQSCGAINNQEPEADDQPDPFDDAMSNCSADADGMCPQAGSEYCEFECPFRDED